MVGGSSLAEFLARHRSVGLDTNILIYLVQDHPRYADGCETLFIRVRDGRLRATVSTVALLEALVLPYRRQHDALAQSFYGLVTRFPGLEIMPVTLQVADRAAQIRARYRLSTPDAIHVATALEARATAFVGNDNALKKVQEIECVTVEDLI